MIRGTVPGEQYVGEIGETAVGHEDIAAAGEREQDRSAFLMRHGILSGSPPGRGGTVQEVQPGAAFGGDERAAFPAVVFKTGAVDRDVVSGQLNRAENPQPRAGREMKRSPAGNLQRLHKIGRGREPDRPFARIEPFLQGTVGGGRGRRAGPGGEAAAGACFPIPRASVKSSRSLLPSAVRVKESNRTGATGLAW